MPRAACAVLALASLGSVCGLRAPKPKDRPAASGRAAVVTQFDEESKYGHCGWVLLESIRGVGRFRGDLLVMDLSSNATRNASKAFEDKVRAFSGTVVRPETAWPHAQYKKLELFTNPAFRKWDRLVYIDADSVVLGPLDSLLRNPLPRGRVIALADNNMYHRKPFDLYTHEYMVGASTAERPPGLPPNRMVNIGSANLLVVDIGHMTAPGTLKDRLSGLITDLGPIVRHFDQSIIHAAWPTELTTLPTCCPPAGDGGANQFMCDFRRADGVAFPEGPGDTRAYCRAARRHMIFHDYRKKCLGYAGVARGYMDASCSTAAGCLE